MYKVSLLTFWDTLETVFVSDSSDECLVFIHSLGNVVYSYDPSDHEYIVCFEVIFNAS